MAPHAYGWIRDKPDFRDYAFRRFQAPVSIPRKFDFVDECPPVKNQFQVGTCAAFATTTLKEHQEIVRGLQYTPLSPRFVFTEGTQAEGRLGQQGMEIRDGLDVLRNMGTPLESDCPYNGGQNAFDLCESPQCLQDAANNKIGGYAKLDNVSQICQALSQHIGVVMGVTVYDSWETQEVDADGIIAYNEGQEKGGHALFDCGFDLDALNGTGWVVFENSWDVTWAQNNPYQAGFGCLALDALQADLDANTGVAFSSTDLLPSPQPVPTPTPTPTPSPDNSTMNELVLAKARKNTNGTETIGQILQRWPW